jgi:flagellar basal-body rod protein FlgB
MGPSSSDATGIGLFDLAEKKLAWLGRRQGVLAQNVANADTPGWKARDLKPFDAVLTSKPPMTASTLVQTAPMHLAGTLPDAASAGMVQRGEQAPDGNAVALDEQMMKIAKTDTDHEMVSAIYRSYLGMFRTALGR